MDTCKKYSIYIIGILIKFFEKPESFGKSYKNQTNEIIIKVLKSY